MFHAIDSLFVAKKLCHLEKKPFLIPLEKTVLCAVQLAKAGCLLGKFWSNLKFSYRNKVICENLCIILNEESVKWKQEY